MPFNLTVATCQLVGQAPYSPSRKHEELWLEGELPDAYDKRTWRSKALVERGTVHISNAGLHQALVSAAAYQGLKIPGAGSKTWTKKFAAGIAVINNIDLGVKPEDLDHIDIFANADGKRGSGKRVMRRFPIINEWSATVDINILDPIVTESVFTDILEVTGLFVGLGRYRPEKGGTNGRFMIKAIDWQENRRFESFRRAA